MDAIIIKACQDNIQNALSARLQRNVRPVAGPPDASNRFPHVPLPPNTILIDAASDTQYPIGTTVDLPNRANISQCQLSAQCIFEHGGNSRTHCHIKCNVDTYGNVYCWVEITPAHTTTTTTNLGGVYFVRNLQAYPAAVWGLIHRINMQNYGNPPSFQLNQFPKVTKFTDLSRPDMDECLKIMIYMKNTVQTSVLTQFELDLHASGGCVGPEPRTGSSTDHADTTVDLDALAAARDAATVRETIINTLRSEFLTLLQERARMAAALDASEQMFMKLDQDTKDKIRILEDKICHLEGAASTAAREYEARLRLLSQSNETHLARQNTDAQHADKDAQHADNVRKLEAQVHALRERVGTLDHTQLTEMKLALESARVKVEDQRRQIAALQTELVQSCQRAVQAGQEVEQARLRVNDATDKTTAADATVRQLRVELDAARKQIAALAQADDVSSAVTQFHTQLQAVQAQLSKAEAERDRVRRDYTTAQARIKKIEDAVAVISNKV